MDALSERPNKLLDSTSLLAYSANDSVSPETPGRTNFRSSFFRFSTAPSLWDGRSFHINRLCRCSHGFRDLAACLSQSIDDLRNSNRVLDPLDIGNGEASDGISLRVQNREADIHHARDLVTGATLVSPCANLRE